MTLRRKVLWIPALTLLALSGVILSVVGALWRASFTELERDRAEGTARSLRSAVREEMAALDGTAADWAEWDDTFEYLSGRNPGFVAANLETDVLANLRVQFLGMFDMEGGTTALRWQDLGAVEQGTVPPAVEQRLRAFVRAAGAGALRAIIAVDNRLFVAAARPVLRSDKSGPPPGVLVVGRAIGAPLLARYSALAAAAVDVVTDPAAVAAAVRAPTGDDGPAPFEALDDDRLAVTVPVQDETGQTVAALRGIVDRSLMREGRRGLAYLLAAVLLCGAALTATVLVVLERQVIRRLEGFAADVQKIGRLDDLDHRVGVTGEDELARTGAAVNGMLDSLQRAVAEKEAADATLRESQARLVEVQKMEAVGRLAGGVAHEYNNLLVVILGHTELIESSAPGAEIERHARAVRAAAERAATLTRQLLAFGRRQVAQPEVIAVGTFLDDAATLLRRVLSADVDVTVRAAPDAGAVFMDRAQLTQVLLNLVINARDAMPDGGAIEVEATAVPPAGAGGRDCVRFAIRDTGPGIPPDVLPRLFEPFFTTKGPLHGSGLGLATVYGLVTQAGGTVKASNRAGGGAEFLVDLPRVAAPAERVAGPAPAARRRAGATRPRVLVVDDTDAVRSLVRMTLEDAGRDVEEAASGMEALERLREEDAPTTLVTDVVMPRMDGRRFAAEMARRVPGLRVLFISGYEEELEAGSDTPFPSAFLAKPFTPKELLRAVDELESAERPAGAVNGR